MALVILGLPSATNYMYGKGIHAALTYTGVNVEARHVDASWVSRGDMADAKVK